jgi:hypothetical protein
MFKTKIKPEVLKELVDIVSVLVDEAKFTATKSKLVVKAVDPAHVAMVDLTLKKDAFEEYSATDTELGVDLDKVKEVLRLAKPGDIISIEHNEEKNVLQFKVGNINRTMALVDPAGMSDPKVPNLNLPVKIIISTEQLRHQGVGIDIRPPRPRRKPRQLRGRSRRRYRPRGPQAPEGRARASGVQGIGPFALPAGLLLEHD